MMRVRRYVLAVCMAAALTAVQVSPSQAGFNDEYVYAMTRGVNGMRVHPAAKVTLYPATLVLDTAFLPFAVIAGFVTG